MNYKDINDYEMIYMIEDNDEYAMTLLRKKYNNLLEYKLSKWRGSLKKYVYYKEDIIQELEMCFLHAVRTFNSSGEVIFYTYLNRVLDNYFKSNLSKYTKDEDEISLYFRNNENEDYLINYIVDNYSDTNDKVNLTILLDFFNDYSMSLNMDQSLIFELYISGYKISEISTLTEKPVNTVKSQIKRIVSRLKEKMKLELSYN